MTTKRAAVIIAVLAAQFGIASTARAVGPLSKAQCISDASASGDATAQCTVYSNYVASCEADPEPTTGTRYYVCDCQTGADANCVAGNDANAGTSKSAPLKTCTQWRNKANALPSGGGAVMICRGGAIDCTGIDDRIANTNCNSGLCTIRDYDPSTAGGGTFNPSITNAYNRPGNDPIVIPGNQPCFYNSQSGTVHDQNYLWENLQCQGANVSGSEGYQAGAWVTDVTVCNITAENVPGGFAGVAGIALADGQTCSYTANDPPGTPAVNNCPFNDRITMKGLTGNNTGMGFFVGSQVKVLGSYLKKIGTRSSNEHVVYYGAEERDSPNNLMRETFAVGEEFSDNVVIDAGENGTCDGQQLIEHGDHGDFSMKRNFVGLPTNASTGNCFGIATVPGTVNLPGREYNVVIDSNVLAGWQNVGIILNGSIGATVTNNLIIGNASAQSIGIGLNLNVGAYDHGGVNYTVANNTIHIVTGVTNSGGIELGQTAAGVQGTGMVFANNLIEFASATGSLNYYCLIDWLGEAALTGANILSTPMSSLTSVSNGGFDITINGVNRQVTGMDFRGLVRTVTVSAGSDNVVASSKTWTLANGAFTGADVGRVLRIVGAANSGNNADHYIQTVTNSTTIVTDAQSVPVNETFGGGVTATIDTPSNQPKIATLIQSAIQTAGGSNVQVTWVGNHFLINTPFSASGLTTIAAAVAPTGGGSPTNVSALLGLTSGAGATTTTPVLTASDNNSCHAAASTLTWEQNRNKTLSQWNTTWGFDAHSKSGIAPAFVSTSFLGTAYWTPQYFSPATAAGSATYAPATDIHGAARSNPPTVGAIEFYKGGNATRF